MSNTQDIMNQHESNVRSYVRSFPVSFSKATGLIATPYNSDSVEDLTDFKIVKLSERLTKQAGRLIFFNGMDDPVVSCLDLCKYQDQLLSAEFKILSAPDHFVRADFPELISF